MNIKYCDNCGRPSQNSIPFRSLDETKWLDLCEDCYYGIIEKSKETVQNVMKGNHNG